MSMTREEAIELLCYGDWLNVISEHIGKQDTERIAEGALERIGTFGRVCILLSLRLQRFGSKQLYLLP